MKTLGWIIFAIYIIVIALFWLYWNRLQVLVWKLCFALEFTGLSKFEWRHCWKFAGIVLENYNDNTALDPFMTARQEWAAHLQL